MRFIASQSNADYADITKVDLERRGDYAPLLTISYGNSTKRADTLRLERVHPHEAAQRVVRQIFFVRTAHEARAKRRSRGSDAR